MSCHVHLLTFLCKMRQGVSHEFLMTIFGYKSGQAVSTIIKNVRTSLMIRFVPENVGLDAITRDDFIDRHVTEFANALYNPQPDTRKAITFIDGTYISVEKSSNFQAARQSFSMQKHHYLLKPALIVAPDDYILDVHGPYFSDAQNNDAAMFIDQVERNANAKEWFQEEDIVIVDRGYRDANPCIRRTGDCDKNACCRAEKSETVYCGRSQRVKISNQTGGL